MNKVRIAAVTAVLIAAGSIAAFANNSGVGLGTVIFKGKKGKVFEVLAVTTNGCFGTSTFAITSGTSGYDEGNNAVGVAKVETFIKQNMDYLAVDMARGQGEYLSALGEMMKVQDQSSFNALMQKNFKNIYTSEEVTAQQVTENIFKVYQG